MSMTSSSEDFLKVKNAFDCSALSPAFIGKLRELAQNARNLRVWNDIDIASAYFIVSRFEKSLTGKAQGEVSKFSVQSLCVFYLVLVLSYCRSEKHICFPESGKSRKSEKNILEDIMEEAVHRLGRRHGGIETSMVSCITGLLPVEGNNESSAKDQNFASMVAIWSHTDFKYALEETGILSLLDGDEVEVPKTPLVLSQNCYYIARSFWYEFKVAQSLRNGLGLTVKSGDMSPEGTFTGNTGTGWQVPLDSLPMLLDSFFPAKNAESLPFKINWQKVSVAEAIRHRFAVITGGPGTGKTTSVARLLSILKALYLKAGKKLRIGMAAPTGKAADRMASSLISNFKEENPANIIELCHKAWGKTDSILSELRCLCAVTIQRMLGLNPETTLCRYNSGNKLPFDLIIIDEASMIDLENFDRLIEATDENTRLIFLGDRDQLASVDAGSVLGDICDIFHHKRGELSDELLALIGAEEKKIASTCGYTPDDMRQSYCSYTKKDPSEEPVYVAPGLGTLLHSYRFDSESAIGKLAYGINYNENFAIKNYVDGKSLLQLENLKDLDTEIKDKKENGGFWVSHLNSGKKAEINAVVDFLFNRCKEHWLQESAERLKSVSQVGGSTEDNWSASVQALFTGFNGFRVLTPVNDGVFGVVELNKAILKKALKFINDRTRFQKEHTSGTEYGDFDEKWFPGLPYMVTKNNKELGVNNGDIGICVYDSKLDKKLIAFENNKSFLPSMLPDIVPAFVMTIHKSQGSEFGHTLVLVPDYARRLLCRELIYTAVTRAKKCITVLGTEKDINTACSHPCERYSGLAQRVYGFKAAI